MSDKIIALGNEFVKETYRMQSTSSIDCINIFHDGSEEINLLDKDYTKSKNSFLWWGSAGAIHKGLDILIDIFKRNKNLNLYICGYNCEAPFDEFMLDEIKNCENIHNEGFVKIGSDRYFEILNLCIAVISPSISEGGAPGVVNIASAAGLIPIVTRNCGLNVLNQEFIIKEVTTQGVWESIDLLISTDIEEIKEISRETKYFFRKNHSYALYKTNLKEIITRVLDK
ncbi:glycosyltransferase [Hymenobacter sp. PAMC 26628]|uniref:glycosyltransferase n=1 Tax=Hymenobacter sp. PAMC 26628 TaxID=1484118 RepID=UPI000902045E|nr:glycosyltransferase [Hymenobacter sp. PAMC 26628]